MSSWRLVQQDLNPCVRGWRPWQPPKRSVDVWSGVILVYRNSYKMTIKNRGIKPPKHPWGSGGRFCLTILFSSTILTKCWSLYWINGTETGLQVWMESLLSRFFLCISSSQSLSHLSFSLTLSLSRFFLSISHFLPPFLLIFSLVIPCPDLFLLFKTQSDVSDVSIITHHSQHALCICVFLYSEIPSRECHHTNLTRQMCTQTSQQTQTHT